MSKRIRGLTRDFIHIDDAPGPFPVVIDPFYDPMLKPVVDMYRDIPLTVSSVRPDVSVPGKLGSAGVEPPWADTYERPVHEE